jgi:hypothetical protein
LDFVKRNRRRARKQSFRVAPGRIGYVEVVEGMKAALSGGQLLHERTLAGLPRSGNDDSGRHTESLRKCVLDVAGKRRCIHLVNDIHSRGK